MGQMMDLNMIMVIKHLIMTIMLFKLNMSTFVAIIVEITIIMSNALIFQPWIM